MEIKNVKLIYFSPTGTTRKVLEGVANGIAVEDVGHIDVTLPEEAMQEIPPFSDGARVWEDSMMKKIADWLYENCSARKEPQIIGID